MTDFPDGPRGHAPAYNPRDAVTPCAFEVDERLLGTELATPKRRLAAFLIDLLLAALIAALGGIFVGFAVAFIFFRIATRRREERSLRRWARATLATLGAGVLFVTVLAVIGGGWNAPFSSSAPDAVEAPERSPEAIMATLRDTVNQQLEREGIPLERLEAAGVPPAVLDFLAADSSSTDATAQREHAVHLLRRYTAAFADGDTAALDSLTAPTRALVAGQQIAQLRSQLRRAAEQIEALESRNDTLAAQAQSPSLWRLVRSTANDVGLRIGWIGVYFTLFLAGWSGQTPGKRLLGLRVVRLDGEPLTLWGSFERFGGYAAGLATGLFGFAQVYWDPNRQAIQDRIAQTVVIRQRST